MKKCMLVLLALIALGSYVNAGTAASGQAQVKTDSQGYGRWKVYQVDANGNTIATADVIGNSIAAALYASPAGTASDPQYVSGPALVGIQAALNAAPAGTPSDNVWTRLTCTAATLKSLSITANTGSNYYTIAAAPGAGLKWRVKRYRFSISGGTTGANTIVLALGSNGVILQGTIYTPYVPNAAAANPGGWYSGWDEHGQGYDYLVCGYNEPLQMYVSGTVAGSGAIDLNLVYEAIP